MTQASATLPRFSIAVGGGRLGHAEVELGAVLAVMALASLVFVPSLGTLGALGFLAAGCALCALRPSRIIARVLRDWPVMLLAVFCILSVTWSREPTLSLRFGVQLAATFVIALAIADRLSPRDFLRTMAACLGVGMFASLIAGGTSGETAAWTGIYGSKNAFAGAASTFAIIGFGLALARGPIALRLILLAGGAMGSLFVVLAQSTGALVLMAITLLACTACLVLGRLSGIAAAAALFGAALIAVLAGLVASAHITALSDAVLQSTGKDLTLTGRTELWAVALALIAERPLLGVGYQAFWVIGNAEAEALWFMFGIEARSGFNFHNLYLSNAVEIGGLGVALQMVVLLGAAVMTLRWVLQSASPVAAVFFGLTLMVVMGSLIEVPLFFQFSLRTVLVVATFSYARDALWRGA
ncbi:MAG: O-antigen ligase family protein [Pseudomonadota bacterium]